MALYLGVGNDGTFVTSDGYLLADSEGVVLRAMPVSSQRKIVLDNVVYRIMSNSKGVENNGN